MQQFVSNINSDTSAEVICQLDWCISNINCLKLKLVNRHDIDHQFLASQVMHLIKALQSYMSENNLLCKTELNVLHYCSLAKLHPLSTLSWHTL